MFNKIKNAVEKELASFLIRLNKSYSLKKTSPLLFKSIKDFVLRKGKRIRPVLFIIGYLSYKDKTPKNLYTAALSFELLHDFMLVHDDIIDKSNIRRGSPSLHKMLNNYLDKHEGVKFNGQDLGIVAGDIIYAFALQAFMSLKEQSERKEKAMQRFIDAAVYTGCGELLELLSGLKKLEDITKQDIYKIYDYKTSYYTFALPLSIGAMLAGACEKQTNQLLQAGLYLGKAFQIQDDILGIFGGEKKTGKSSLTDLQEAKKTLLIWYSFNNSNKKIKHTIKNLLSKRKATQENLYAMRKIISSSGALGYGEKQIDYFLKQAFFLLSSSKMKENCKTSLINYFQKLFDGSGCFPTRHSHQSKNPETCGFLPKLAP